MISPTQWQYFGTAKMQENEVLLKKSLLPRVGKMSEMSLPKLEI